MKENFNVRDKKGSIALFVLVGLLFMSGFLIILYGYNVNKSKIAKEQFNSISDIYSHKDGNISAYDRAYTALRKKNKQTLTKTVENSSVLELDKTYEENLVNYRIYGSGGKKYQQVEYIESTGTQYINTKYYAKGNSSYSFKYSDHKNSGVMFGAYNTTWQTGSGFYVNINNDNNNPYLHYYSNTRININYYDSGTIQINKGKFYFNDIEYESLADKEFSVNYPTYIFAGNWCGQRIEQPTQYKLYYFKIYEGEELIRDFIPCYSRIDNEFGLYDKVTKEFYMNQGDGMFENGNTVISEEIPESLGNGVGDLISDTSDSNYGKYKINIRVTNSKGEHIIKEIVLNAPLFKGDYIDFKTSKVIRGYGTEEQVTLPEILINEDYTKIEVSTEGKPSKIEVEYEGYTLEYNARLPRGYNELEYIESTGTQYIDTKYYAKGNSSYSFKYSDYKNNGVMFGAYNTTWETGNGLYLNKGSNPYLHYYSNTKININYYDSGTIQINKGKFYFNDIEYESLADKEFLVNYPTYIFAGNWRGQRVEEPTQYKLYYFKIYEGEELIRDFIPCYKKEDNTIGMYDTVEGKFYTNAGTGQFIAGPEV